MNKDDYDTNSNVSNTDDDTRGNDDKDPNDNDDNDKNLINGEEEKEKDICTSYAQNMTVVDMRENRMLSITPANRSISQTQSRDAGNACL